jgi:hypothetical protein
MDGIRAMLCFVEFYAAGGSESIITIIIITEPQKVQILQAEKFLEETFGN